jgi:hypothetical protein
MTDITPDILARFRWVDGTPMCVGSSRAGKAPKGMVTPVSTAQAAQSHTETTRGGWRMRVQASGDERVTGEPSDPKSARPSPSGVCAPAVNLKSLGSQNKIRLSLATFNPSLHWVARQRGPPKRSGNRDLRGKRPRPVVPMICESRGTVFSRCGGPNTERRERECRSPGFTSLLAGLQARIKVLSATAGR